MYKKLVWILLLNIAFFTTSAQVTTPPDSTIQQADSLTNKVVLAPDTVSPRLLRIPDSATKAFYLEQLNKGYTYNQLDLNSLIKNYKGDSNRVSTYMNGDLLAKGDVWILAFITFLLLLFSILKNATAKQLLTVIQSFYSNRILGNLIKEENLFTSWPFMLLFVQLGFTVGMFFYLILQYHNIHVAANGFDLFLTISILIIVLFLFKVVLLRLLGFIFNTQKPVQEYVSILYLSYFNASLLFIPLVVIFALSPLRYAPIYIVIGYVLLITIFAFQFVRAGINILSQYRFSKVYLFLYFCTLEICPILILIKAIGL